MTRRIPASLSLLFGILVAAVTTTCATSSRHQPAPASVPFVPNDVAERLSTRPGPAPQKRSFDPSATNAECERCHGDIASEWRDSLHQAAHTDPMVQHQFEREPFPFCTGCHAPESNATVPVPERLSHLGVACITCHVVGDHILAAANPPVYGAHGSSPHAITRTIGFDGVLGCGACHEFAFPDTTHQTHPLLMQATMKEHALSQYANRSCSSCHMPVVAGRNEGKHKSHRFAASRDEALVRSAIRIEQGPFVDDTLMLTLHAGEVGHAFPTGDMLRRLALEIDVVDASGLSVEHAAHYFQRHFGFVREPFKSPRKVVLHDDRVGVTASPVVFRYATHARPPGGHLRYTLRYERIADPSGEMSGGAVVEGAILLAAGVISLPKNASPVDH